MIPKWPRRFLMLAALAVATPNVVQAQQCLGSPAGNGRFQLGAGAGFSDAGTSFDVNILKRFSGPFSVGAYVQMVDFDYLADNATAFGGHVSYELAGMTSVSACPYAGIGYLSADYNFGAFGNFGWAITSIPIGFGVGKKMDMSSGMYWIPNANVALVFSSVSTDYNGASGAESSSSEFGFNFGATLGKNNWFVKGVISFSGAENSGTSFYIGGGLLLGGG